MIPRPAHFVLVADRVGERVDDGVTVGVLVLMGVTVDDRVPVGVAVLLRVPVTDAV